MEQTGFVRPDHGSIRNNGRIDVPVLCTSTQPMNHAYRIAVCSVLRRQRGDLPVVGVHVGIAGESPGGHWVAFGSLWGSFWEQKDVEKSTM